METMLFNDDCLTRLRDLPESSIDSLITDPPAGISFMGKDWDKDKGGRDKWIAWMTEVMKECHRVLKPGAHGLVWAIPRTSHWTATALENAGFEVRDVVTHLFGSGFPKSLDISKAIDKAAGAERIKGAPKPYTNENIKNNNYDAGGGRERIQTFHELPATTEAKQWQGWGTALKPASEHWILVRKPCSEKTVAANVLKHGCGGINIDASRIEAGVDHLINATRNGGKRDGFMTSELVATAHPQGRFPANLLLSHTLFCEHVGVKTVKAISGGLRKAKHAKGEPSWTLAMDQRKRPEHGGADGTETVEAWHCTEDCPVRLLDEQSGVSKSVAGVRRNQYKAVNDYNGDKPKDIMVSHSDTGGASRFFYVAKASKSERNAGLHGMPENTALYNNTGLKNNGDGSPRPITTPQNHHPTVKPQKLMQYLIKLITPPGGVILDPFFGSGSTGVAAIALGHGIIGIERDPEYFEIAKRRCNK